MICSHPRLRTFTFSDGKTIQFETGLKAGDPSTTADAVISWSYRQLNPSLAHVFRGLGLHPGPDVGVAAVASLVDRPTAVVTANNFLAFGLLDAAREAGLRVPEDLAVVTFDDVEVVTDSPFFTCAAQPAEALGRTAVERLIARLGGDESPPGETVLQSELRIRRSCGCP